MTLNFAHLEFCFTLFAGSHSGIEQPLNEIITSELSFRQLLNVTGGIYKITEPITENKLKFDEIVRQANILEQQRNTITHSFYGHNPESKIIVRNKNTTKGKQGFKSQSEIINANSVNKIAIEISDLSKEIIKMIFAFSTEKTSF